MAHHQHWNDRGAAAFKELSGPKGGDTGNANHGYNTARGGKQVAGSSGQAGSFEGPAKPAAKLIGELVGGKLASQSGGKGTKNGSTLGKLVGKISKNPAGGTSNYKSGSVAVLTGTGKGGKHNGRAN